MSIWDKIASPFVSAGEAIAGVATDGYSAAQSAAEQASSAIVDVSADALRSAEDVGTIIGDGVVAAAGTVGEGVVTFGDGAQRFSVSQAGAVVDWSKTTASEVSAWSENAAGTVSAFTMDTYNTAKDGVVTAWNYISSWLTSKLPVLGPYNPAAREILYYLFATMTDQIERANRRDGTTVGFTLKLTLPVGPLSLGIYCDSTGQWGFYDGNLGSVANFQLSLSSNVSADVEVITVFGDKSKFSGRDVLKFGAQVRVGGPVRVGAHIMVTAGFSFVGFAFSFGLTSDSTPGQSEPGKYKLTYPRPNQAALAVAVGGLTSTLSEEAPSWDAAIRSQVNPENASRIVATALAATVSPFDPRYSGLLRTSESSPRSISIYDTSYFSGPNLSKLGPAGRSLGMVQIGGMPQQTILATSEATIRLVTGLGDPSGVSVEVQAAGRTLVLAQNAPYGLCLVPYTTAGLRSGTVATFKLVRGLADDKCVSLTSFSDANSYVVASGIYLEMAPFADTAQFKQSATLRLDKPSTLSPAQTSYLRTGEFLSTDESRRAGSGSHFLALRSTGVLDVYKGSGPADAVAHCWNSPGVSIMGAFHAIMQSDGRLVVYRGSDPQHRQEQIWASEVFGTPGDCFAAVTAAGQLAIFRGSPEKPGDLVWSSSHGAYNYAIARRSRVALRTYSGKYLSCVGGTGAELTASASGVGQSELFDLLTLWNSKVALYSSNGFYVCAENGGDSVGLVNVNRGVASTWESFDLITLSGGVINLRSSSGMFLCAENGGGGQVHANRTVAAEWERFAVVDVPAECGWKEVRPQDKLVLTSSPALAATPMNGRMWAAYRGADNKLVLMLADGFVEFGAPQTLAYTTVVGSPSLAGHSSSNDVLTLHRGSNNAAWLASNNGMATTWSSFESIGGVHASSPAIVRGWLANTDAFSVNGSGDLIHSFYWEGSWQPWESLGHPAGITLDSPPAVFSDDSGHHVFTRGTDKKLWYRRWTSQGWSAWQDLGGSLKSAPTVACTGSSQLEVFARGDDDSLIRRSYNSGTWSAWERLGGRISSAPAATSRVGGGVDVVARSMSNGMIQTWYANGAWLHKL